MNRFTKPIPLRGPGRRTYRRDAGGGSLLQDAMNSRGEGETGKREPGSEAHHGPGQSLSWEKSVESLHAHCAQCTVLCELDAELDGGRQHTSQSSMYSRSPAVRSTRVFEAFAAIGALQGHECSSSAALPTPGSNTGSSP